MKKNIFINKKIIFFLLVFFLLDIGLFWAWRSSVTRTSTTKTVVEKRSFPELLGSDLRSKTFEELKTYFQNLAEKKGARYAYEVLKQVKVGQNIDMHLLGHVVGDELYKQEGLEGITDCTNDFRNACSHSIVTGLFFDKGDNALEDIAAACRKAPGGSGAYTMCFHGLGHGILAYEGFDMAKTAAMCKKTGTAQYNYQESTECIGGSVMEIIGGGGHDHEIWVRQRPKYLDPKHPLALCQSDYIPDQSRFMCYEYITPFLFEAVGADMGNPSSENFESAFKFCNQLLPADLQNRDACFGGFGKEFDGIVQARDIRLQALKDISDEQLKQIYSWCLLAREEKGTAACIVHALNSLYWGGETESSVSVRFCKQVTDMYNKNSCFMSLLNAAFYYTKDGEKRKQICDQFPPTHVQACKEKFSL